MRKSIALVIVTMLLICCLPSVSIGETYSINASPKNKAELILSLSGGQAKVKITLFLMTGYTGSSSVTQKRKNGDKWTNVMTWNPAKSGQQYTIPVASGTYRAVSTTKLSKTGQGVIDTLNNYTSEKSF